MTNKSGKTRKRKEKKLVKQKEVFELSDDNESSGGRCIENSVLIL